MKRLIIPAVVIALIIAGVFWYRHEQYKACVRLQMAITWDFATAQDRCDRPEDKECAKNAGIDFMWAEIWRLGA